MERDMGRLTYSSTARGQHAHTRVEQNRIRIEKNRTEKKIFFYFHYKHEIDSKKKKENEKEKQYENTRGKCVEPWLKAVSKSVGGGLIVLDHLPEGSGEIRECSGYVQSFQSLFL